mgnify:CR=1 FL=1
MAKKTKNNTLDRLKTMSKNSRGNLMRNNLRILKYGVIGYGRNIWLSITSTFVMTLTLILLFVTIIASIILSSTADRMRDKIDITIFFRPGTEVSTLQEMTDIIKKDSNVKSAEYSTSEQEYEKFVEETKKTSDVALLATLNDDEMKEVMLKSMQSTIRVKVYNADRLDNIKDIVNMNATFRENIDTKKEPTYNTNDTAIETIASWSNIAKTGGFALSGIFLIISILVIFNTIRMAIYSRSEEIYMEKLVGADNHFVRGPFLVEAMISGILAGIFSTIIGFLLFGFAAPKLTSYDIDISEISKVIYSPKMCLIALSLIFLGMIIAFSSSRLAVSKYLKRV